MIDTGRGVAKSLQQMLGAERGSIQCRYGQGERCMHYGLCSQMIYLHWLHFFYNPSNGITVTDISVMQTEGSTTLYEGAPAIEAPGASAIRRVRTSLAS